MVAGSMEKCYDLKISLNNTKKYFYETPVSAIFSHAKFKIHSTPSLAGNRYK